MVKGIYILAVLSLLSLEIQAQFASAKVSKKKVVVEQPVKVMVTAYSPTWFAEPLSFENLQVNGAFIQSFSRTVSGIQYVNNKKYATLDFYYIIFPYTSGEIVFPELTITTSIPPEGEYKGKPVTLKTKPITIQVDPVPDNADADRWLVANDVRVNNSWSMDLKQLKKGEVIERTISIRAAGTLPSFIDVPDIGTVDFASVYNSEPSFFDDRDEKAANGRRVDKFAYLLEKEGEFIVPEVKVTWWNPHMGRFYSRTLPEYKLIVSENSAINSLSHLRDSLQALNPTLAAVAEEADEVDYSSWYRYTIFGLLVIVVVLILAKFVKRIRKLAAARRQAYRESEAYWYDQIKRQTNASGLLNALYQWLDHLKDGPKTLSSLTGDDPDFAKILEDLQKAQFQEQTDEVFDKNQIKALLHHLSNRMRNGDVRRSNKKYPAVLNP